MFKQIHLIRTFYPHWGQYSGIHRFIEYVNPDKFRLDVQVVPIGQSNFPIPISSVRNRVRHWVKKNGVREYDLNDLTAEVVALNKWLSGRVDLFHYLDGEHSLQYMPSLVRRLSRVRAKPPIVATFHQPPQDLDSFLNIDIVRRLDRVIVLAPEQGSYFEQYLPKNKISQILHGVDVDYFQPATKPKKGEKFKCLSVGSWLRDYDTVLAVAERLQTYPDIEFHIVSSKVTTLPENKNVYLYKGIDDAELLQLYQQSDVLFLPLFGATANNAILEGIACGLPVVSTELPSIRAYVPGQEAVLIPENNPELLVKTLLDIYHNPEVCAEMVQYARKRAIELSWANITKQLETIYFELLG